MRGLVSRPGIGGGEPFLLPPLMLICDRFVLDLCDERVVGGDWPLSRYEFSVVDDLLPGSPFSLLPELSLSPFVFFIDALLLRRRLMSFKNEGIASQ